MDVCISTAIEMTSEMPWGGSQILQSLHPALQLFLESLSTDARIQRCNQRA